MFRDTYELLGKAARSCTPFIYNVKLVFYANLYSQI